MHTTRLFRILVCFTCLLTVAIGCRSTHPGTTAYNVRDFGATGDGKTLDSPAINQAIDAARDSGRRHGAGAGGNLS